MRWPEFGSEHDAAAHRLTGEGMIDRAIALFGTAEPVPAEITLTAGPLSAIFTNGALRRVRPHVPQILTVVDDEQFQEDNILADLDTFGAFEDETPALPAVLRYRRSVCWLESHRPLTLLGQHYVLEGSKNGAKFIAKAVRAAYALTPGVGDRFLDPYGDRQRVKWMQFKAAMDAATFTEAERGDVLTGAQEMFRTVIGLAADLSAAELATCPA